MLYWLVYILVFDSLLHFDYDTPTVCFIYILLYACPFVVLILHTEPFTLGTSHVFFWRVHFCICPSYLSSFLFSTDVNMIIVWDAVYDSLKRRENGWTDFHRGFGFSFDVFEHSLPHSNSRLCKCLTFAIVAIRYIFQHKCECKTGTMLNGCFFLPFTAFSYFINNFQKFKISMHLKSLPL